MDTEQAKQLLNAALTQLRNTYSKVRGRSYWYDACSTRDSSVCERLNVFELNEADYQDFCWHSTCMGDPKSIPIAVRYSLPRIAADLSNIDHLPLRFSPWCDAQLVHLLNTHEWRSWPENERDAIENWFHTWIDYTATIGHWSKCVRATECAAMAGCDMIDFFHGLRKENRILSALWLAHLIEDNWEELVQSGWPGGWRDYWGRELPPRERVVRFIGLLLGDSSRGVLQEQFFETENADYQQLLPRALEHADYCIQFGKDIGAEAPLAAAISSHRLDE